MGVISATDTYGNGTDAVFKGAYDVDYQTVTITVDNTAIGTADTVLTGTAMGNEYYIPAEPANKTFDPIQVKDEAVGSVTAINDYNIGEKIVLCQNGDYLIFYHPGTDHVSTSNEVVYKRCPAGSDPGQTASWSTETLIKSHGTYGVRIFVAGVDPVTGRVMIFTKVGGDAPTYTTYEFRYLYSDDHGQTWIESTDYYPTMQADTVNYQSYFPVGSPNGDPDALAFGKIIRTSVGLMVPVFTGERNVMVVFSYDNGDTWDFANPVVVDRQTTGKQFVEPYPVQLDGDNIVLMCRDQVDDRGKCNYAKTTDGGLTWTAFSASSPVYSGSTQPDQPAPAAGLCIGERVYGCFTLREPLGKFVFTCVTKAEFLADPSDLWNPSKTGGLIRTEVDITPDGRPGYDAGYFDMERIPGHEYTCLAICYSPGSVEDATDLLLRTVPVV